MQLFAGDQDRIETEWQRTAWLAMQIINISGKVVRRGVTVKQLLRPAAPLVTPEMESDFWSRIRADRKARGVSEGPE